MQRTEHKAIQNLILYPSLIDSYWTLKFFFYLNNRKLKTDLFLIRLFTHFLSFLGKERTLSK